jgi:hypothetical protein
MFPGVYDKDIMVIVPKEKAVIENLNSYYLDIKKLFEHYQGDLGSGAIHFKSPSSECAVFFDKDELLTGTFKDKRGEVVGKQAIESLSEALVRENFAVNIYEIDPEKVYFWANIPNAERIYNNLSTEFTDLEGLIKKMSSEKLTGYIDVSINNGKEGGLIFFSNGEINGGSYSWGEGEVNHSKEAQQLLIEKTKKSGGTFDVSRISLPNGVMVSQSRGVGRERLSDVLSTLEELLVIFERIVEDNKGIKADFNTLLKRKFVDKAEEFGFLDPFAAEFEYVDQKVQFNGNASNEELAKGVTESLKELAEELGILPQFRDESNNWSEAHARELERLGIRF